MVVMRRKLAAQNKLNNQGGLRGGISSNSGIFALSYTNTGKHLMGRTASRAKTLPPLLRAFKNRRVDCCSGTSEAATVSSCVPSTAGIEKNPIIQISNRNRLRRLANKCAEGCVDLSANPLWKLSPEQHASARTERLAAITIKNVDISCNYFNNTNNKKTRVGVNRSQNSLIRGRVGNCPTTKDIKKNNSASLVISRKKAEALFCDAGRTAFNNKKCTPI